MRRGALGAHLRCTGTLVLLLSLASSSGQGQAPDDGRPGWYFGSDFAVALTPGPVDPNYCRAENEHRGGLAVGTYLTRSVALEVTGAVHAADVECASLGVEERDGSVLRQNYPDGISEDLYGSTEGRLVVEGAVAGFPGSIRLVGGGGWIAGKALGFLLGGAGLRLGRGGFRATVDLEHRWVFIPVKTALLQYRDGALVSEQRWAETLVSEPVYLRVGFQVVL